MWRRGQGAIKADTRRTMADAWRTHGRQTPGTREHIAASLFLSREPHGNRFGDHTSIDPNAHCSEKKYLMMPRLCSTRPVPGGKHRRHKTRTMFGDAAEEWPGNMVRRVGPRGMNQGLPLGILQFMRRTSTETKTMFKLQTFARDNAK